MNIFPVRTIAPHIKKRGRPIIPGRPLELEVYLLSQRELLSLLSDQTDRNVSLKNFHSNGSHLLTCEESQIMDRVRPHGCTFKCDRSFGENGIIRNYEPEFEG